MEIFKKTLKLADACMKPPNSPG